MTTWTSRSSTGNYNWSSIVYGKDSSGNGLFVAVSMNAFSFDRVATSYDGINWQPQNAARILAWRGLAYGKDPSNNGVFVAVSSNNLLSGANRVMTSYNGIDWALQTAENFSYIAIAYGGGKFVAMGTGTIVSTSSDGITWNSTIMPFSRTTVSIAYGQDPSGNGIFFALGTGANSAASYNGTDWFSVTNSAYAGWSSVTYGHDPSNNGLFVAVASSSGNVMTSNNGVNWTTRTAATADAWNSITFGEGFGQGLFVAVSAAKTMSSSDGINWTAYDPAANNVWKSVAYNPDLKLFAAISNTGTDNRIMTAPFPENTIVAPTLSDFTIPQKIYGDVSFNLVPPQSNSSGAFVYSSSDPNIAVIVGDQLCVKGIGTCIITATQAATDAYLEGQITANFTAVKGIVQINTPYGLSHILNTTATYGIIGLQEIDVDYLASISLKELTSSVGTTMRFGNGGGVKPEDWVGGARPG